MVLGSVLPEQASDGFFSFRKRRVCLLAAAGLLTGLLTGCAQHGPGCTLGRATELPLREASGHLIATVLLNGMPATMIVDTGASVTMVTRAAADRLGLALEDVGQVRGIGGSVRAFRFVSHRFQIGTLRGGRFDMLAGDVPFRAGSGLADGFLGADFLAAYALDLDLPEHRAIFYTVVSGCAAPAAVLNAPTYQAALYTPAGAADVRPMVRVTIGGQHLTALIDSGSPDTAMFRNAARRIGLDIGAMTQAPQRLAGGVGPRAVAAVRQVAPPITIGEVTISNLPVAILDQRSDDAADMLLGMDFLQRVHAWFAFGAHTLIMQIPPGPSPSAARVPG